MSAATAPPDMSHAWILYKDFSAAHDKINMAILSVILTVAHIYIYIYVYIYICGQPPLTTRTPLKNTVNTDASAVFSESNFGAVSTDWKHKCKTQEIQKSKNPKTQKSKNPKIQKNKNPKLFTSTESFLDFWIFRLLDFWVFGLLDF